MFIINPKFEKTVQDFCKAQESATDLVIGRELFNIMQKQGLIKEWGNMPYYAGARVQVVNTRRVNLVSQERKLVVSMLRMLDINPEFIERADLKPDFADVFVRNAVDAVMENLPTDALHHYRISCKGAAVLNTSRTPVVLFREAIAHACVQNGNLSLKDAWHSAVESSIMNAHEQAQFPRGQWSIDGMYATYSSSSATGRSCTADCTLLYLIVCDMLGIRSFNYSEQNDGSISADGRVTQVDLFIEYLYERIAHELNVRKIPGTY